MRYVRSRVKGASMQQESRALQVSPPRDRTQIVWNNFILCRLLSLYYIHSKQDGLQSPYFSNANGFDCFGENISSSYP